MILFAALKRPLQFLTALAFCAALTAPVEAAKPFNFDDVAERARTLAAAPWKNAPSPLPKELLTLEYDQYRDIRFNPEKSLWRKDKLPFELAFFHPGLYFDHPVKIHEVSPRGVKEVEFNPADFNYGANTQLDRSKLRGVGFAGFRVHYPLNTPQYKDELLVFLGASYFRVLGKGQHYGLSARGLAVDTALNSGEEFPRFNEFWIERPSADAKELTIYALLDSKRMSGAYRFIVKPGSDTVVDVKAQLFLRENVAKLGIAPLTSMFFFGENQPAPSEDYRPEVHDSDGLSIQAGTGEWIWRPLSNPKRLLVSSFTLTNPQGFGLMQRDRDFGHYEDLEARYEMRPSTWIEPRGNWGNGRVELVQIPTPDETNDNIVAYWVPEAPAKPGEPVTMEYRMLWQKAVEKRPPLSWVVQTRRGHGFMKKDDLKKEADNVYLHVDFEGPALQKLAADAPVEPQVTVGQTGQLLEAIAHRNEVTGGWRMTIKLRRTDKDQPVELRAFLRNGTNTLSETWSYLLPPG